MTGKLNSTDQVAAAVKFLEKKEQVNDQEFNDACGVGVVYTPEQITRHVTTILNHRKDDLLQERYKLVKGLLPEVQKGLRWAPMLQVKEEFDKQITELLGPKDERDDGKAKKPKEAPVVDNQATKAQTTTSKVEDLAKSLQFVKEGEMSRLHKPGGNPQIKPELMVEHLKATGGKVYTRFPPEPNGYLHIGHAKAININFAYAQAHNGVTYLRYDDSNPEAEEQKYFDAILEMVQWLGFEPWKITYASDNFQKLYELAIQLIKNDKAYVCHCSAEEIHHHRGEQGKPRTECIHRNRPIEESLTEFTAMREGKYAIGKATLRMKMDLTHGNPQFWDLVAYRVLNTPHVRTGTDWPIYPTYDYVHCICDSLENITHSLCTTEFVSARESYYWLVDELEIYKPVQWEYGRLNLTNAVLSKRKLLQLVNDKVVHGWDDPRLFTLAAVRRRGFTPQAINAFVRDLGGVTTALTTINVNRLENYVRDHLNDIAPRLMAVLDPIKVTITNLPDDYLLELEVPNKPRDEAMGSHKIPFTRTVFIDAIDFREVDDANYKRLAPGKTVGLLNVPKPITATGYKKDPVTGLVTEVEAVYDEGKKPKAWIQWVADSPAHKSPVKTEIRLYNDLFLHSDPTENPNGWLADINPDSLKIHANAMVEVGLRGSKVEDKFQFLRVGYFCVDPDSNPAADKWVLNRTVTLKVRIQKEC